jgi:AcrR family transcriptional regulator
MAGMPGRKRPGNVGREEWLEAGLAALRRDGVDGVRVERLARDLGISKSGFYWHFADRAELRSALLDYWDRVYTRVVTADPRFREGPPRERLRAIARIVLDEDLTRYDLAMRAWAEQDPEVAKRVRRVYRVRLDFVRPILVELGFQGDDLEMRTRLFVAYASWERVTFWTLPKSRLRRLIDRRIELLTRR